MKTTALIEKKRNNFMAKDDYHVLVYQILSYLYQRLKQGENVQEAMLLPNSPLFPVKLNKRYWAYILYHLQKDGLVEGLELLQVDGLPHPYPARLDRCLITPAGMEYLCDNSFMEKAKRFLKEIHEIVPFSM